MAGAPHSSGVSPAQRRPQLAVAVGVMLAGAGFMAGASQMSSEAGYAGVGPNFLPWVVGGMLLLFGAALLREACTGGFRSLQAPEPEVGGDWIGFAFVSAGILLNAALITRIGFILSCTLCFVLAARGFRWAQGDRRLTLRHAGIDVALGAAIAAPVYWMFSKLLSISLPGLTTTGWL